VAPLLDPRAGDLEFAGVPTGSDPEGVAALGEVAQRGDLLGQQDRMADGEHEDAGAEPHPLGERRGIGQDVERF
jgi:hypothetical protein